MSVLQPEKIDIASIRQGRAVLTIVDPLDWRDAEEHLRVLQAKVSAYVRIVQRGELPVVFPAAVGKPVTIELRLRHRPPVEVADKLSSVAPTLGTLGIAFVLSLRP